MNMMAKEKTIFTARELFEMEANYEDCRDGHIYSEDDVFDNVAASKMEFFRATTKAITHRMVADVDPRNDPTEVAI